MHQHEGLKCMLRRYADADGPGPGVAVIGPAVERSALRYPHFRSRTTWRSIAICAYIRQTRIFRNSTIAPEVVAMTSRMKFWPALVCIVGAWLASAPALAQNEHADHAAGENLGTVHFPISCSPEAQRQFDRAVAMLHSFYYPETIKAFTAIATAEPSCAMAYWGIAISQRPNPLVAPFPTEVLRQGLAAIKQARAAHATTRRERDWIDALAVFFEDYDTVNQKTRTAAYEAAMGRLHQSYPHDTEAAVFYALALNEAVDLTDKSYSRQLKAAAMLESLQRQLPDHPGIPHYLIHSYDYAPIAAKGLPAARRYAGLAPSAPHALHMPSHIFSTLGMWQDAIRSDLASVEAINAVSARAEPTASVNVTPNPLAFHSLDFLANAYLQLAQDQRAKAIVDARNSISEYPANVRYSGHTAFAAIPVRYCIERGAWAEAAALQPASTPYAQAEAITWFGRALGAARSGDLAGARLDVREIERLRDQLALAHDSYWTEQLDIQRKAAGAWIELGEKMLDEAIEAMRDAADREDRTEKHVAMENRLSPMRELLGELLLEAKRPGEAAHEFELSLRTAPNRFRSLAGAGQAAEMSGDRARARIHYQQLVALARDADSERPALTHARQFLAAP
jgi:tetratricopeptide (TPR) repeat protein